MSKSKDTDNLTPEERDMANELLELERLQKEKELKQLEKKKEKELIKLEKEQAKINGVPYVESKKVEEPVVEEIIKEEVLVSNSKSSKDDVTFNSSLKAFLRDIDPKKKKRRYNVLIEELYKFASGGNKEAIRAIIMMVERIEGRPGINQNNSDEDKENPLAQEIHALAEIMRDKNVKKDGDEST